LVWLLSGIESKLDYFGKLGVNTLIIGPIYPTENIDFGYDVTDHVAINPEMGTMADFDSLLKKAHKKREYTTTSSRGMNQNSFIEEHT
jgi:glycosidase